MAKRDERPIHAADWDTKFESHGRVAIQLSRRRLWLLSAVGVVCFGGGLAMSFAGSLSTTDRVVGGLVTLMGAAFLVVFIAQLRQKGPAVVVDARGVTARYTWRGDRLVPWPEIRDTGVYRTHGTAMVLLMISPEFETHLLASGRGGRAGRALATANRGLVGGHSISLPSPLKADPDDLALWIERKASEQRAGNI